MTDNPPLFNAAHKGRIDDLVALLPENGQDINVLNGTGSTALMGAAEQGHLKIVRLLLENGANAAIVNSCGCTALSYARQRGYYAIVDLLNNPPPLKPLLKNPDEVIFRSKLSDRTLEEVFNFATLERITLIRNGEHGPVEAVTRDSFASIEGESALRKAFEEHVRRGGTVDEGVIFSRHLVKNRLPPGGP